MACHGTGDFPDARATSHNELGGFEGCIITARPAMLDGMPDRPFRAVDELIRRVPHCRRPTGPDTHPRPDDPDDWRERC